MGRRSIRLKKVALVLLAFLRRPGMGSLRGFSIRKSVGFVPEFIGSGPQSLPLGAWPGFVSRLLTYRRHFSTDFYSGQVFERGVLHPGSFPVGCVVLKSARPGKNTPVKLCWRIVGPIFWRLAPYGHDLKKQRASDFRHRPSRKYHHMWPGAPAL